MRYILLSFYLTLGLSCFAGPDAADMNRSSVNTLSTIAEQSNWKRTGRYAEVTALCEQFTAAYPGRVACIRFGQTPEGRPMLALVVSSDGALDPATNKAHNRPVVFFQGGIHAGEIDGKDAGFLLLRELLRSERAPGSLSKLTLVFVPVFNVDGHERFGKNNRPNQNGPEEMGWRTTALNFNLNRDYMKADSPEMAAMLKFLHAWDPILFLDLHVTDGAEFQHDVSIIVNPSLKGPDPLAQVGRDLASEVARELKGMGHLPLAFYPSFIKDDDPMSGFADHISSPRYSQSYWGSNNRIGVLVETHSWKDYATRVKATHDTLLTFIELATKEGEAWLKAAKRTDEQTKSLGGSQYALTYEATRQAKTIEFMGYKFERVQSEVSGRTYTRYDPKSPEVWKVPFYSDLKPALSVSVPKGGYIVPAIHAGWTSEKLKLHGIEFQTLTAKPAQDVEIFRASDFAFAQFPFEGRQGVTVKGKWEKGTQDICAGSLFVPIAQAKARLVLFLFEPQSPESFLSWGFFNAAFEQKEYLESYLAEEFAKDLLARNPALRKEFKTRLETDPEFAKDAEKRLQFFSELHPSWDSKIGLYPILRTGPLTSHSD